MLLFNHRSSFGARFVLILALLAGLFGLAPVSPVHASTLIVPDNYRTIQAAINAASPGDTILVRAGTYFERLTLNKSVILTAASFDSSDPTRNTSIIDGGSSASAATITIPAGVSPMPTIRGFVIRNGLDNIKVISEAIIEYNYFVSGGDQLDYAAGGGGIVRYNVFFNSRDDAIDLDNMTRPLLIEHNRLMYNRDDGIEIRLQDAKAPAQPVTITIRDNQIIGCDEDGIQFIDYGQAVDTNRNFTITGNLIANCRFAGIGLMGNAITKEDYSGADIIETIRVYNNTIYGNDYGISGGDNLTAYNNIIANSTTRGVWRVQGPAGASSVVAYTLFYNNGTDAEQSTLGAGNLFGQNPRFASAPNPGPDGIWKTPDDDFSGLVLQPGSPAIDAGYDPVCPATDLRGVSRPQGAHCDLGAFEAATAAGPRLPVAASLISPTGNVAGPRPAYTWNTVMDSAQGDAATWYLLRVRKAGNIVVLNQWYQSVDICSGSTCSVQSPISLTGVTHTWEVQTWNSAGYGPWSNPLSFFVLLPPGKVSLLSPSGAIANTTPTFSWNVPSDNDTADPATWYYLWVNGPSGNVIKQWYQASAICNNTTCSATSSIVLRGGVHTWWVQTWNSVGYGPWSEGKSFSLPLPAATTLVSPSGSIADTTPIYTWNKVIGVTWYYLWIDGPSGNVIKEWYEAPLICGASTCSVTPVTALSNGNHTWWVQTWNNAGYGPWSEGMSFSLSLLGAATLTSPSGNIATDTPAYTWNEVPGATWYYLWVNGPSGNVIKQWYEASDVCSGGTCSVTPATALSSGNHTWWVQTWNNAGYGPWSTAKNFTVSH